MVSILKSLNPATDPGCLGTNTKPFFTGYPSFSSMSIELKNKMTMFFNKLVVADISYQTSGNLLSLFAKQHESAKYVADKR